MEFLGFSDAETVFSRLDALVVPSLWREPFGRIYAESMVHGVPVVGSVHGAGRELVIEGRTGWLCDPRSSSDLERALERVVSALSAGTFFREACLEAGSRFSPESVANAYAKFYTQAMEIGAIAREQASLPIRMRVV